MAKYTPFGTQCEGIEESLLDYESAKQLLRACHLHPSFKVIELRKINVNGIIGDIIIVDCTNSNVASRNFVGIKLVERLALVYYSSDLVKYPHEVRALRADFPVTLHQNHVLQGEPVSLCLYFQPWSHIERSWTPQQHLKRILWWLRETAGGTLHHITQPVEQLYFESPDLIVLPANFNNEAKLMFEFVSESSSLKKVLRGQVKNNNQSKIDKYTDTLILNLSPIIQQPIERFPYNLGELNDQLSNRGSEIFKLLIQAIQTRTPDTGLSLIDPKNDIVLLILRVPIIRTADSKPERIDLISFFINSSLASLGIKTGALLHIPGKKTAYIDTKLLPSDISKIESIVKEGQWRAIEITPVHTRFELSPDLARKASGVTEKYVDFKGVIAGVGALGSALAELWSREAWGNWTYIDDDILLPHNIVRHIGEDCHIGLSKVEVERQLTELNYAPDLKTSKGIQGKITDKRNKPLCKLLVKLIY